MLETLIPVINIAFNGWPKATVLLTFLVILNAVLACGIGPFGKYVLVGK